MRQRCMAPLSGLPGGNANSAGLPCTSIMWGAWAFGMAAAAPATLRRLERAGMGALGPAQGLAALAGLLAGLLPRPSAGSGSGRIATPAQTVVNPFIWASLRRPGRDAPFLFASLVADISAVHAHLQPQTEPAAAQHERVPAQSRIAVPAGPPPAERHDALEGELLELVRGMLGPEVGACTFLKHSQVADVPCVSGLNALDVPPVLHGQDCCRASFAAYMHHMEGGCHGVGFWGNPTLYASPVLPGHQ